VSQSLPEQQPNPEAQRLLLLQAMGIRSYYPRFRLPGALPSVACAWLGDEVPHRPVVTGSDARPVSALLPEALLNSDIMPPEPQVRPSTPAAAPVPISPVQKVPTAPLRRTAPQATAEPAAGLSFQVLLLQADKGLVICNQLPAVARPALGRGEQQLLNNMLLWLGCSLQPGAAQRHFSWPLPGLTTTDADLAGKGLLSFLAQAQQDSGFTHLLLLGNSSVECLQPHLNDGNVPWQTWCTHSLSELLALPELKRSAWQQLQTLHAGLR
jgi:hypothetical protein